MPCEFLSPLSTFHACRKLRDIPATNEHLTDQTATQEKAVGFPQGHTDDVLLKVSRGPVPHLGSLAVSRKGSGHCGVEGALEKVWGGGRAEAAFHAVP